MKSMEAKHPSKKKKSDPSLTRRRSLRQRTRQGEDSENGGDGDKAEGKSTNTSPPRPRRRKSNGDHPDGAAMRLDDSGGEEVVKRTVKELMEMDEQRQRDCKRQRQQIENSDLVDSEVDIQREAFRPVIRRPTNEVLRPEEGPEQTMRGDVDKAPMGEEAGKELVSQTAKDRKANDERVDAVVGKGIHRPPPVNSEYLPIPWKGRLGYACLNTYLRTANPPVFCSRTCRIASILEHRHQLQYPEEPEHPTKNRPDKSKPANVELGQKYVQGLGLANARDIVKMIRWNEKYGIRFLRLSSEMFPFASHEEHGYKLAPFASEVLAEAGRLAGQLGHRLTTHPGQFTQLGSPRNEVITASVRDLEYHDEMLSLLRLPDQLDRDSVMIIHMGGTYGDKAATLDRFRVNYKSLLSPSVKRRLVLENDDVSWSVHDLLPVCEELNIPLVLDFHHHNIVFDAEAGIREGTLDIMPLFGRIAATWKRKGITQKMHYSEPCAGSVTPRERRKHSPRVRSLPPCAPDMDLMIEAKDKEQAVFELMRSFRLPGWDRINTVVPYERHDEDRRVLRNAGAVAVGKKGTTADKKPADKKTTTKKNKTKDKNMKSDSDEEWDVEDKVGDGVEEIRVAPEDFAMGGPENRVYWPEGEGDWLKPKKRERKAARVE